MAKGPLPQALWAPLYETTMPLVDMTEQPLDHLSTSPSSIIYAKQSPNMHTRHQFVQSHYIALH